MPWSDRRRSLASLQRSGSPTVDQRARAGDVAAEAADRFGECVLDHVKGVRGAIRLADAAAARTVHTDRVHLVDISHGAIALGEIADPVDPRDIAVHGVKAFEHNQLRAVWIGRGKERFEMRHVVVAENLLLATRLAHALDH
jgi:hypothetical protein